MKITADCRNKTVYVRLVGEIDEHNAALARRQADKLAEEYAIRCENAVFDLQNVSFMDSTGIGFLIGRYKKFRSCGVPVYVMNPSLSTDKILSMSGVYSLMPKI